MQQELLGLSKNPSKYQLSPPQALIRTYPCVVAPERPDTVRVFRELQ